MSQFLGYCVKLINTEFPWMHVVKGRPRKPSTQGSIEVSHKAFKAALVKWLDKKGTPDWVLGARIVQCEVNNCPMRSRGNISPHTIYYGKPPGVTYSATLGPAYKTAATEYGLRLAKRVLLQIKDMFPNMVITQEQVQSFIKSGDDIWEICKEDTDQDSTELLNVAFYQCLDDAGIVLTSDTEIRPDVPDIFDESEDITLDNILCDVGDGLLDSLDYNEEINNFDEYLEPDNDNFMDCLEDGNDVYNIQRCNVDEEDEADVQNNDNDINDDLTLHECNTSDDPNQMAQTGEVHCPGMKDVDDVDNVQRCNEEDDVGAYVHANDTDVKDDDPIQGGDINHLSKPMAKIGEETLQECDYDNDIQMPESHNENECNIGGNVAGNLVECVIAKESDMKDQGINESEQIQEHNDDGLSLSSQTTEPVYARVIEEDSNIYRDGYTVQLPKTEDSFMVYLFGTSTGVPFVEEYYAAFGGYIKHKDGRRAYAEELSVFRNEDDVVVALDGSDLSGRPLSELVLQITSAPIGTIIKLTMINKSAFNGRYYRSVKKGNG